MDLLDTMSVTLIVKAPNEKIDDHRVECGTEWTVRRLKEHLSMVYPSKPESKQQRLIYSGKLLKDDARLKEFLHKFDPEQTTHILHLLCHPCTSASSSSSPESTPVSSQRSEPAPVESEPARLSPAPELRHRHNHLTTESTQPNGSVGESVENPVDQTYMNYDPQQQLLWMQHVYAQQMSAYMQYYQQSGQTMGYNPYTPITGTQPPHIPAAPPQPAPPINEQPGRAAANQDQGGVVRMNAGGGAMFDDEEEDEGLHRDWLDWLYTISRLVVFLTIVYFYSSLSRFAVVIFFFLIFYMYQAGYFRIQRRERAPQPRPQAAPERPTEERAESDTDGEEPVQVPPPTIHPLNVLYNFIIHFFTSLIPQPPPPLNIN